MPISITSQETCQIKKNIMSDTDVNATIVKNIILKGGKISYLKVDNSATTGGSTVYFKIWDHQNPTLGVDEPDFIFPIQNTTIKELIFEEPLVFKNGISYCCVRENILAGNTNPSTTVAIKMIIE